MRYLLDTCTFIWYMTKDNKLPDDVRRIIFDSDNVYASIATLWEIAVKQTTGKLSVVTMSVYEIAELCRNDGIIIMPIKIAYLERIKKMPLIHRDPFDRIITATAVEENMTLLTKDSGIIKYDGVKTLWESN